MLASLRTRLWFSYAVLIAALLAIVATGLGLALLQSPRLLYPEAVYQMRLASELLPANIEQAIHSDPQRVARILQREGQARNLRLIVVGPDRSTSVDTGGAELPLARIIRGDLLRPMSADQVRLIRTRTSGNWLYMLRRLEGGSTLLVLSPAPAVTLRALFRDQFVSTFLYAGLAALALAFVLAFLMSGWITAPLRRMVAASRAVARGEHAVVPVDGPGEVQELARAMNEMSQRVQATQQSQRDFVANISHELKTPLTSIQGFAQAIQEGAVHTQESLQQAAGVIYHEANRMHRLVIELLSLSRLEGGTADLRFEPVDMDLLLQGILQKFAPQAAKAQVELSVDAADLPALLGDGDRLSQVFTNLVDNAIKFTPAGGRVGVETEQEGAWLVVKVIDTGRGIQPEDQARIFERFYQEDRSRRGGSGRGIGLGLPIARQIILAHGGEISVESQPAQGSCFVVKLPLSKADLPIGKKKSKG